MKVRFNLMCEISFKTEGETQREDYTGRREEGQNIKSKTSSYQKTEGNFFCLASCHQIKCFILAYCETVVDFP